MVTRSPAVSRPRGAGRLPAPPWAESGPGPGASRTRCTQPRAPRSFGREKRDLRLDVIRERTAQKMWCTYANTRSAGDLCAAPHITQSTHIVSLNTCRSWALWVLAVARAQASARASGGPRHHSRASALSPTPRLVTLRRSHGSMSGRQGSPRRRRRAAAGAAFSTSRPRGYACARPAPAPPQGLASRRWRRRATAWSTRPSARSRRRTRLSAGRRAGG